MPEVRGREHQDRLLRQPTTIKDVLGGPPRGRPAHAPRVQELLVQLLREPTGRPLDETNDQCQEENHGETMRQNLLTPVMLRYKVVYEATFDTPEEASAFSDGIKALGAKPRPIATVDGKFTQRALRLKRTLENIPPNWERIGTVYKTVRRNVGSYRTFQRDITTLALEGHVRARKQYGGANGRTTIIRRTP
jgi:hypothetical protein